MIRPNQSLASVEKDHDVEQQSLLHGGAGEQEGISKKAVSDVWKVSPTQNCVTKILPFRQVEGNHFLVYGTKRAVGSSTSRAPLHAYFPFHCILGPDYCCSFLTTGLILSANVYWFYLMMLSKANFFLVGGGICFGLALLTAYSKTAYSDPGIVKRLTKEEFNQLPKQSDPVCRMCNIYRQPGTRHCYDCDACILKHDHHCPWTGKCIGKNNEQYFYAFLGSLFADLIYVIISATVAMAHSK